MDAGNIANPYLGLAQGKLNDCLIGAAQKGNIREILPLVEAGADVNAIDNNDWTALIHADVKNHIEIINLLKKCGAKGEPTVDNKRIRAIVARPFLNLELYAPYIEGGVETVFYDEIYFKINFYESRGLISQHHLNLIKGTFPESFYEIPPSFDHLKALFNSIQKIVKQGLQDAEAQGKKLLLVAGERHTSLNSLFFQIALLEAAKEKEINHVLVELSESHLNKILYSHRYSTINMAHSIPYSVNSLNMEVKAMDIDGKNKESDEMLDIRDNHMCKVALDCDKHSVVFCGSFHLKCFNDHSLLNQKNHVVLMNITGYSDEIIKKQFEMVQKYKDFFRQGQMSRVTFELTLPPTVIRLQMEGNMQLFSHEQILDWRNMHKNKYGSQPASIFSSFNQLATTAFEIPKFISSSASSIFTQVSTYVPSLFGRSKDVEMKKEVELSNKRKRPEDEVEKNKNARKRLRIGSGSSRSQDE